MLHIHGGSVLLETIRQSGIPGERLEWSDALCQGPTPRGLADDAWYALRAGFLNTAYGPLGSRNVRADLEAQDRALARAVDHDEVVLWFGPELFCQAILIRILAHFSAHPPTRFSLICVDRYPGVDDQRSCTLGALSGGQLMDLFGRRAAVSSAQLELGRRAWDAMGAPTPEALAAFARDDTSALPFLKGALLRLLAELPAIHTGLSRTEHLILAALEPRALAGIELFVSANEPEPRRWMTDTILMDHVRRLATGPGALLEWHPNGADPLKADVRLLPAARDVLQGRRDAIEIREIDRWVGGTHLTTENVWRWDEEKEQVVS